MSEPVPSDSARPDISGLIEKARHGDRVSLESFLFELLLRSSKRVGAAERTEPSISGADSAEAKAAVRDLMAYMPRIEARDPGLFLRFWAVVVRSLLRPDLERLRAKRRELVATRPLPADAAVLIDPPRAAVTSVSRLNAKSDEYSRTRALLPILEPADEEMFLRAKLLGEPAEQIAADHGKSTEWVGKRSARAYQRLFSSIGRAREGRIDEALRERDASTEAAPSNLIRSDGKVARSSDEDSNSGAARPVVAGR